MHFDVKNNIYRKDIDGLRAIAVLSVVFFHAFPKLIPGGFIGVDVFFVISGYLISGIIYREMKENRFSLGRFYLRRIKRIFPALIVFLLFFSLLSFQFFFDDELKNFAKHIMASTLFLNNFLLWHEVGYFDKLSELKPLLHLWSLGIEEQFYLFWPFVLIFTVKNKRNFPLVMWLIILGSFALNLIKVHHHAAATFYLPFTRIWELGVGGLIAYYQLEQNDIRLSKLNIFGKYVSYILLVMFLVCLFKYNESLLYPSWYALIPILFASTLLFFPNKLNHDVIANKYLVSIGLISYPLYLWHWGLLSFAKIIYGPHLSIKFVICLLGVSFLLSYLTYNYVEKPLRQRHYFRNETYLAIFLLSCMICLFVMASVTFLKDGFKSREVNKFALVMNKDIHYFDDYKKQTTICSFHSKISNPTVCLQSQKQQPEIAIWGDSHAEHLFPGIINADKRHSWVLLEKSGCPPLLDVAAYWKGDSDSCADFNYSVMKVLKNDKRINTVYLSSLGLFYLGESHAVEHQGRYVPDNFILTSLKHVGSTKEEVFEQGLEQTIFELIQSGKKVVLIDDIPSLPFMPDTCIMRNVRWFTRNQCVLDRKHPNIVAQIRYSNLLQRIQYRHPEIQLISFKDKLCDDKQCSFRLNKHLLMRDSHHLSLYGSRYLASALLNQDSIS